MKIYFIVVFRNIYRHWRQALAAILSISAGFAALVLFEGYIEDAKVLIEVQFRQRLMYGDVNIERDRLWTAEGRAEPWKFALNKEAQDFLQNYLDRAPEIEGWSRFLRLDGLVANGQVTSLFFGMGYDIASGYKIRRADWYWNSLYGQPLEKATEPSVMLGKGLGVALGCRPDPEVEVVSTIHGYPPGERKFVCDSQRLQFSSFTPTGQVSALDLKVIGMADLGIKELDAKYLFMPLDHAQSLAHTTDVSFISVLLKDSHQSREFSRALTKAAHDNGLDLTASDWREHKEIGNMYRRTVSLLNVFRNFVIIVILSIATLSVMNTLIKMVKERTREIGTWRSLGYTEVQLKIIFAMEAAALGVVGSFLGIVLSVIFSVLINVIRITYRAGLFVEPVPFSIAIVPQDYLLSVLALVCICVLSSFYAIRDVFKSKVYENLIHV